jgi:hypothetical protein
MGRTKQIAGILYDSMWVWIIISLLTSAFTATMAMGAPDFIDEFHRLSCSSNHTTLESFLTVSLMSFALGITLNLKQAGIVALLSQESN